MKTVVHVTHEAVQKIGGIGAVLHGLITSKVYRVGRQARHFAWAAVYDRGPGGGTPAWREGALQRRRRHPQYALCE